MRIAIIGRTEMLYKTAKLISEKGYEIPLIITSKETPEYKVTAEDFKQLAKELNADFIYSGTLEKDEIVQQIASHPKIDLAISINFTGVISKRIIDLFEHGILNAHGGDLPKYRGNACQAWAIINGEHEIGLCIHRMRPDELDSGDIIEKKLYPININTRVQEVYDWFETDIPGLMLSAVKKIENNGNGQFEQQSTDPEKILRCYPRIPEDGQIDWKQNNIDIIRLINASSEPYAGAYCFHNDKKIVLWRAVLAESDERYLAVPGQVASIDRSSGNIIVITGNGKILVTEIGIDGKRMRPADYFKSVRARLV